MLFILPVLILSLSVPGVCNSELTLAEGVVCSPPYTACYNQGLPVVCKNLQIDPANCGACGNVCSTGQVCYNSTCQAGGSSGGGGGGASWDAGVIVQNPKDFPGSSWANPAYVLTDAGGGGGGGGSVTQGGPWTVTVDGGQIGIVGTVPVTLPDGGVVINGIGSGVTVPVTLPDGGVVINGIGSGVTVPVTLPDGGVVINGFGSGVSLPNGTNNIGQVTLPDGGVVINGSVDLPVHINSGPGSVSTNPFYVVALNDGGAPPTSVTTCVGTETAVGTSDTKIPATNQTSRRTIVIINYGPFTIWCSESSGVTALHGFPIAPNGAFAVDSTDAVQWYCVANTNQAQASGADTWSEECKGP